MKPTIIVIGSSEIIKLGLVRSFGALGYKIISIHVGGSNNFLMRPLDYYSKYISAYYFTKADDLVDLLIEKCKDAVQNPILLPLNDSMVHLVDQSRLKLSQHFLFPNVKQKEEGITKLMNKVLQKRIAAEAGLHVARIWEIPFVNGNFVIPADIEYPCFVKGVLSYKSKKKYQKKCNNSHELDGLLNLCKRNNVYDLYAEEFLDINREVGIMALSSSKGCATPALVELLRMGKGSTNGVSMLGRVCSMDNYTDLEKKIGSFLKSINYTGICNIDFIESRGKMYFVEVNFRYATYGYAIFKSGVNIPEMIIHSLCNNDIRDYGTLPKCNNTYFNEKVGLNNVMEGFISYQEYKDMRDNSNILMINDSSDPKPNNMMWTLVARNVINKVISMTKRKITPLRRTK